MGLIKLEPYERWQSLQFVYYTTNKHLFPITHIVESVANCNWGDCNWLSLDFGVSYSWNELILNKLEKPINMDEIYMGKHDLTSYIASSIVWPVVYIPCSDLTLLSVIRFDICICVCLCTEGLCSCSDCFIRKPSAPAYMAYLFNSNTTPPPPTTFPYTIHDSGFRWPNCCRIKFYTL